MRNRNKMNGAEQMRWIPSLPAFGQAVRFIVFALSFPLLALLALGACASAGGGEKAEAGLSLDVSALGERLYQDLEFRDTLEELEPAVVYTLLGVDENDVAAQKNYFSSGATAEEIILFQAAGQEAAGRLKAILEARVKEQKEVYASYAPEEVTYLDAAVLREAGDYLIFCVALDGQAAAELIDGMLEN